MRVATPRPRRTVAQLPAGDDGAVLILVIGFCMIATMLITVIVNSSRVYLAQRALVGAADGAATAGAQAVDEAAVYSGGGDLPLSPELVDHAVHQYVEDAGLVDRFDALAITSIRTDGRTVTVTMRARVKMPFVNVVSRRYHDGVPISETASARSPLRASDAQAAPRQPREYRATRR